MGTTPIYAFPYPEPTDLVRDGAQNFEDLADAVETTIDGLQSGAFTLLSSGSLAGIAQVTVTGLPSTFQKLYVRANNLKTSGAQHDITLRVNSIATGYAGRGLTHQISGSSGNFNAGAFGTLRIDTTAGAYFSCTIENLDVPATQGRVCFTTFFQSRGGLPGLVYQVQSIQLAAALSTLTIINTAGAFATGDYQVWGIQ